MTAWHLDRRQLCCKHKAQTQRLRENRTFHLNRWKHRNDDFSKLLWDWKVNNDQWDSQVKISPNLARFDWCIDNDKHCLPLSYILHCNGFIFLALHCKGREVYWSWRQDNRPSPWDWPAVANSKHPAHIPGDICPIFYQDVNFKETFILGMCPILFYLQIFIKMSILMKSTFLGIYVWGFVKFYSSHKLLWWQF